MRGGNFQWELGLLPLLALSACSSSSNPGFTIRDEFYVGQLGRYYALPENRALSFGAAETPNGTRIYMAPSGGHPTIEQARTEAVEACRRFFAEEKATRTVEACRIARENGQEIEDLYKHTAAARASQRELDSAKGRMLTSFVSIAASAVSGGRGYAPAPVFTGPTPSEVETAQYAAKRAAEETAKEAGAREVAAREAAAGAASTGSSPVGGSTPVAASGSCPVGPRCKEVSDRAQAIVERWTARIPGLGSISQTGRAGYCAMSAAAEAFRVCEQEWRAAGQSMCAEAAAEAARGAQRTADQSAQTERDATVGDSRQACGAPLGYRKEPEFEFGRIEFDPAAPRPSSPPPPAPPPSRPSRASSGGGSGGLR